MMAPRVPGEPSGAGPNPRSPSRRRCVAGGVAAIAMAAIPGQASAIRYPSGAVRLIVGQAPGGQSDTIARMIARQFGQRWNKTVIVVNHAGASGTIAGRLVAHAPADGYTLLVGSNATIASAAVDPEAAGYDPVRDWAPVGRIVRSGIVFVVRPGLDVTTVQDFVALARARAGAITVSTAGAGSNSSQAVALIEQSAGISTLAIPYNGAALQLQAVVAGVVDATICDASVARPFAARGAVRILAATARRRLALLPHVPTFIEAGYPEVVSEPWYGIVAPAGTPAAVIAELVGALHAALADSDARRKFEMLGFEPIVETSDQFANEIRADLEHARATAVGSGHRNGS